MTPAARYQAAIEVLDTYLTGTRADSALKSWGRGHRFAGSSDRRAIRDIVFDAIRCQRSFAAMGGGMTGRGLVIGRLKANGTPVASVFSSEQYAPNKLDEHEAAHLLSDPAMTATEAANLPDWLYDTLGADLGDEFVRYTAALKQRAPTFVRANLAKTSFETAFEALKTDGFEPKGVDGSRTAIKLVNQPHRLASSCAWLTGLVDLQDASSQNSVLSITFDGPAKILDMCAGGGGKSLALAAAAPAGSTVHAWDVDADRMEDIDERAQRLGVEVTQVEQPEQNAPYDLVFCDVPCSGSGSWRRDPEGKWQIDAAQLDKLVITQTAILQRAVDFTRQGGSVCYTTCSVLSTENSEQVNALTVGNSSIKLLHERRWMPTDCGDGFYFAQLKVEG
jgi:16S rRNA (cytosine967-C5)-methyltransferase